MWKHGVFPEWLLIIFIASFGLAFFPGRMETGFQVMLPLEMSDGLGLGCLETSALLRSLPHGGGWGWESHTSTENQG